MDYYIYKILGYKTLNFLELSANKIQNTYKNYISYKNYKKNKKNFNFNNNLNEIYNNKINLYKNKINLYKKNKLINELSIYNYWI